MSRTRNGYRDTVAAPQYRVVRRSRSAVARTSLTAASVPVDDPKKAFKSSMAGGGSGKSNWQNDAWDMLDAVGELRYYVGWRASSCSRVRLIASDIDPETGRPTGNTDNPRVAEIVRAIAGGPLGQAQLIKRAVECLTVPGETWIAIIHPPEGEQWLALSRDEITSKQNKVEVERPSGEKYTMQLSTEAGAPGLDSMFRIWNPHPRRASQADSPVRATLDSLREIVRTTKTISNASKSRLIGNGVVFVPQEMSIPATSNLNATNGPGQPTAVDPIAEELVGGSAVQQLQELLFQVAMTAYDDEDSMAALIPMFAAVPGDQVKNVSHLKFDNSVTEIAIKTRNDAIARTAMGLDVTPERLLGLGSTTNHWSAWQVGDDDVRLHISPPMETVVQAITDQVFRPVLDREGIDPASYTIWYDASELTADPDLTDEATSAFDRGAITAEAYRDFLGLGDTGYDFSTLVGWQDWAKDRVSHKPELLETLLPLLTQLEGTIEVQAAPAVEPPPSTEDEPDDEPDTEGSEPDTEGDPPPEASNTAEVAIVQVMVSRALELAGKRRRSRTDHNRLRDVPMHQTHKYMSPVTTAQIPDLIKGWDAAMEDDVLRRMGINPERVRLSVRTALTNELTAKVVDA